jgi:hypothetical protein
MMTAKQALANSTHFKNEGVYWLRLCIEARHAGDGEALTHARRQLAKVAMQLRTVNRWQNEKAA